MSIQLSSLITPVKPTATVPYQSAAESASDVEVVKSLTEHFTTVSPSALNLVGKVVSAIFKDQDTPAGKEPQPLSPFTSTPSSMGATTSPSAVVDFLRSEGAVIPYGGKEMGVSLNSLSLLSGIYSGTVSSINSGRMKMDAEKLEHWRKALVVIGKHNNIDWLISFDNPENYLDSLVEDYVTMASSIPLERIEDWAERCTDMLGSEIADKLSKATLSAVEYVNAIIGVWREQYLTGDIDALLGCNDFISVMKHYTKSKSTKRGFSKLIPIVHRGMPSFSSRVHYQVKLTSYYTARYTGATSETGLTADILLAYCFYTGMNPMSLIRWLASSEMRNPGEHVSEGKTFEINDLVGWLGTVSPWEFNAFVKLVSSLGLVSDQEKWALCIYDASNIYRNIPEKADIERSLGDKALTFDDTLSKFFFSNPEMPKPCSTIGVVPYSKLSGELQITTMVEPQAYQNAFFLYALGDDRLSEKCSEMEAEEVNESVAKVLRRVYRNALLPSEVGVEDRTHTDLTPLDTTTRMVVASTIYKGVIKHHQLEVRASSL